MGKHEPNSPKAIANRIKSKGLQKLRWYCQMCQKQCRDQNGFKCHTSSEAHQRQLLLFGENPNQFLHSYSGEFDKGFMDILRRRYGTRRVSANQVYQEYIKDKNHIHMNSTRWMSLTGFCMYLGKSGKAVVDETEKGWFIKYIERDPEEIRRQESLRRREKVELDDEERTQKFVAEQAEKAKEDNTVPDAEFTDLQREGDNKIQFSLIPVSVKVEEDAEASTSSGVNVTRSTPEFKIPFRMNALQVAARSVASSRASSVASSVARSTSSVQEKKRSALDEIMDEERKRKQKAPKKDHWLHRNIVVKIITSRLGEEYFKKKGVVKDLPDKYTAMIELLDSGTVVKMDQVHVETVLPAIGKTVMVLNGPYCGEEATLLGINEDRFSATIKLNTGPFRGETVNNVDYSDISKLMKE